MMTPDSTRNSFEAREWDMVVIAFGELNRSKPDEVSKFRATFRLTTRDAG